jgi:hypothetical protein
VSCGGHSVADGNAASFDDAPNRVIDFDQTPALLDRFPHAVLYRVSADYLFVVAVAHQNRLPGYGVIVSSRGGRDAVPGTISTKIDHSGGLA